MSILSILEFPDPRLRLHAAPVTVFDAKLKQLGADLLQTMYAANGVGLANARILEKSGSQVYQEGCLSFPGMFADVTRALNIKVKAQDTHGKDITLELEGPLAVCIQHEIDHLDGKMFVDYLSSLKRALLLKRLDKQRKQAASA